MAKRGRKLYWTDKRVEMLVRTIKKYCKEKLHETFRDHGSEKSPKLIGPHIASIEDFCKRRHVNHSTLSSLEEKYPELKAAIKGIVRARNEMLIKFGVLGIYNPVFCIFAAKNLMDWKDTALIDQSQKKEEHFHFSTIDNITKEINEQRRTRAVANAAPENGPRTESEPGLILGESPERIALGQASGNHGGDPGSQEGNGPVS
jgi:hypothetical protein